jgi:hypothetical protein
MTSRGWYVDVFSVSQHDRYPSWWVTWLCYHWCLGSHRETCARYQTSVCTPSTVPAARSLGKRHQCCTMFLAAWDDVMHERVAVLVLGHPVVEYVQVQAGQTCTKDPLYAITHQTGGLVSDATKVRHGELTVVPPDTAAVVRPFDAECGTVGPRHNSSVRAKTQQLSNQCCVALAQDRLPDLVQATLLPKTGSSIPAQARIAESRQRRFEQA